MMFLLFLYDCIGLWRMRRSPGMMAPAILRYRDGAKKKPLYFIIVARGGVALDLARNFDQYRMEREEESH